MSQSTSTDAFVVIGAGPAGLTAAYELAKLGLRPVVLEQGARVGGLARTESYRDFRFDLGGHRFFTKAAPVLTMWREVLGPELLRRPRLSRIYYNGRFFAYPLKASNALRGLGFWPGLLIVGSYLRWQVAPYPRERTFEEWVTNRFGRRLFRTFFKAYTEKVWGVPCSALNAEWAAQRIKDLSLRTAVLTMFVRPRKTIKTLTEEFHYPRLGPGMMWQAVRDEVIRRGATVHMDSEVVAIERVGSRITGVVTARNGSRRAVAGAHFISSMPVSELIARLDPPAPEEVRRAAVQLRYRDFLTVCLIVDRAEVFQDNWIYVHDPGVKVSRIQNFKNWSPDMVPDRSKTSLGLEYFCTEGDPLWRASDAELVELGRREVATIGLARAAEIVDGCVIRVPKAYPIYDRTYAEHLAVVRRFVEGLENLQTIGRNGLHRYNNQDHAMVTGMLAVRNAVRGEHHDLWSVNTDAEYHEEIFAAEQSRELGDAGMSPAAPSLERALRWVFPRLDRVAFGLALGSVGAAALSLATAALVLEPGPLAGLAALLGQYLPGYRVSPLGSVLGLAYGFLAGFATGWTFAGLRNLTVFVYMAAIRRRLEAPLLRRLLDYV